MSWFPFYLLALVGLRCFATSREKTVLSILMVAGGGSTVLANTVMPMIHDSWKLAIPGAVETLTILSIVTMAPHSRITFFQVILLLISWCVHLQCYRDCENNTNVVYDNYEKILAAVAVGQLLAFYDTWFNIGRNLQRWAHLWADGGRFVSPASRSAGVVRTEIDPGE